MIMICILIFKWPISTTQVVISGLFGISLIYFDSAKEGLNWFFTEAILWMTIPFVGLIVSYACHELIKTQIFEHKDARKRVIILTPY